MSDLEQARKHWAEEVRFNTVLADIARFTYEQCRTQASKERLVKSLSDLFTAQAHLLAVST